MLVFHLVNTTNKSVLELNEAVVFGRYKNCSGARTCLLELIIFVVRVVCLLVKCIPL